MAYIVSNDDYRIIQQPSRTIHYKAQLLNASLQVIDEITAITDGSVTIDADSDIRRTCEITLADEGQTFKQGFYNRLWLDKFIKLYAGEEDILTGKTLWYSLGIFLINNPRDTFDAKTNTVSISGVDMMAKLTGMRNGCLNGLVNVIYAETPIREAVISCVSELGGFKNYIVADEGLKIPYDIKMDTSGTIYGLLNEIRNLYPMHEMYFDEEGIFHYGLIADGIGDTTVLDFTQLTRDIIINVNIERSYENVKNSITVYGKIQSSGVQRIGKAVNNNTDSPFAVSKLGEISLALSGGEYDYLYTQEQVDERARYELYLHSNLQDKITLGCVPIYWLDVNKKLYFELKQKNVEGEFLIKNLTIPLNVNSPMNITAMKIYRQN